MLWRMKSFSSSVVSSPMASGHASVQLPPELWHKILRNQVNFSVTETKALSLVCRLFASIFQESLFQRLCVNAKVGVDYKRNAPFNPHPLQPLGSNRSPTQELPWEEWERSMVGCILSERRISLIGNHELLARHPHSLRVHGYGSGQLLPLNPFQPPSENQALSRSVFNAFTHFRWTFLDTLPAFTHLRRLELFGYPVEANLLKTLDAHPSLTELSFDFCWFPESTAPMTSITFLSFGYIPGSHRDPSQRLDVKYRHIRSAFNLISPPHIKALDVSFGARGGDTALVFEELCAAVSSKGSFKALQRLIWRFRWISDSGNLLTPPSFFVIRFLERTPDLRSLSVQGYPPAWPLNQTFPAHCLPLLESIFCPVGWATHLVPGRPINNLRLHLPVALTDPNPLSANERELGDFFGPFKRSTSQITTLHLPILPPLAPVWLLFPYLTSEFPFLRELKVPIMTEPLAQPIRLRRKGRSPGDLPPSYSNDTTDQEVEGELLDALERNVRDRVQTRLTGGTFEANLPSIVDRVMTFRGVEEGGFEIAKMQVIKARARSLVESRSSRSALRLGPPPPPPSPFHLPPPPPFCLPPPPPLPPSPPPPPSPSPPPPPPPPLTSPLPPPPTSPLPPTTPRPTFTFSRFERMFCKLDMHSGIPHAKPDCALDVVYFLARGYYTLPSTLRSLTLFSCFQEGYMGQYSGILNMSESREDYASCTAAVLGELSLAYPELSAYAQSSVAMTSCPVQYYGRRVSDSRESGFVWELESSTTSDRESLTSL